MGTTRDYKRLAVWGKAHDLTLRAYCATERFPRQEIYGLTSQLRRAVASIPTNIAEGCGRGSSTELARFMDIARGSTCETEYLTFLCHDLGYLPAAADDDLLTRVAEVGRMLTAYARKLRQGDQS